MKAADALAAVTYEPPMDALMRGDVPVTTRQGAIEALRLLSEDMGDFGDTKLARPITAAVLEFLESDSIRAAQVA